MSEAVQMNIQKIIDDDPIIGTKGILVSLRKEGGFFKKKFSLELTGKVSSDKDAERAMEIAEKWASGLQITNNITVG